MAGMGGPIGFNHAALKAFITSRQFDLVTVMDLVLSVEKDLIKTITTKET